MKIFSNHVGSNMKYFLYLSLLVTAVNCLYISDDPVQLKIDNTAVADSINVTDAPYLAQILYYYSPICEGVIISPKWILAAAHCTDVFKRGITVTTGNGEEHYVKSINNHEDYNSPIEFDNDITLIELDEAIQFNGYQTSIPIASDKPEAGDLLKVIGFGQEGNLRAGSFPVVDQEECRKLYVNDDDHTYDIDITDNMLCVGTGETSQEDSEGPAVADGILVGIKSFSLNSGSNKAPEVYTQVYKYRSWIAETTGLDLDNAQETTVPNVNDVQE